MQTFRVHRYMTPTFQPYGGWAWKASCLLPPSAVSLFAWVLIPLEGAHRGVHWGNLGENVNQQGSFSVGTVLAFLALDVLLFWGICLYLDKVQLWCRAALVSCLTWLRP